MTLLLPERHRTDHHRGPVLEVHLDAVAANTRLLAARTQGALMAVVKADGLGHGAAAVAATALDSGATWLGVTSIAEARALRAAGLRAPLLSWLNPVDADHAAALGEGIDLGVPGAAHLAAVGRAARRTGVRARVHLHLDTGLARDGAAPAEWESLCRRARRLERQGLVRVVGVTGHLACADVPDDPANERGRQTFDRGLVVARAAGLRPEVHHLAATAATLTDPSSHHTLSRVGAGLVGIDPSGSTRSPALTLSAPVVAVRSVPAGTGVGYGHAWVAERRTTLALLPLGYADGLPRAASGRAEVLLGARRCRVVGTISMDQVVVDVGDHPVGCGEVATVFGPGPAADGPPAPTVADWARWAGTIEHEIVTGIGPRVTHAVGGAR